MIKKIFLFALLALLIFVVYLIVNTLTFNSLQDHSPVNNTTVSLQVDPDAIGHLSKAINIETVSPENESDFDSVQFRNFRSFLEETYPLTDSILVKQVFNEFSYLYKWEGTDPDLKPIALMGHTDVVPVIEENLADWKQEPFSGKIVNDTIWGRGTMDDKAGVIGIMESVEMLLKEGYQPRRTVYLAFGHDEEVGGFRGMKEITEHLGTESVEFEFVVDEGGSITSKMVPGIDEDIAMIGIAEKGFLSLELSINLIGGHSSTPEKETAIDVLAQAVSRLKQNPFPPVISPPLEGFIDYLGPEMPFMQKMVFANRSVFQPLIFQIYGSSGSTNAIIRTTTSPTMFHSGVKDNIIPQSARATVNFRIIPGETVEFVMDYVREIIDDDRITIEQKEFYSNPSKVSGIDSYGYEVVERTITEIYPGVLTSPFLVLGATDSRYFNDLSDNILRFSAFRIHKDNVKSFHGINERLSVKEFEKMILFYHQLIKNSTD